MKAGTLAEEGVPETFNLGGRGLVAAGQGQEVRVTQRAKESSRKKRAGGCQLSALGEPRQPGGHRSKLPVFFVFLKLLKIFKQPLTNSCQEYCEKAPGVKKLPSEWEDSAGGWGEQRWSPQGWGAGTDEVLTSDQSL